MRSIHLMELSPPAFRTFVVGTSYQLGNLVSSASATIEATIGQQFPLPPKVSGKKITPRYQYGKVICIFLGCVSSPAYFLHTRPLQGIS
jgi:SHS family lactate transporter-like MFS transporter